MLAPCSTWHATQVSNAGRQRRGGGAAADLDDVGIGKHLVQDLQLAAQLERVDDPVAVARADLHQADEADVGALVVVLQVHGDLGRLFELVEHLQQLLGRVDKHGLGVVEGLRGLRGLLHKQALWVLQRCDLGRVRMDEPAASRQRWLALLPTDSG